MYRLPGKSANRLDPFSKLFLSIVITVFVLFAAWLTHVIVCLKAGLWGFLIAGAIFFPIAIIHGFGIWLGL